MCLIALTKAGEKAMPYHDLKASWSSNSDGAGYAFVQEGKIVVKKPYFRLKELAKDYYRDFMAFGDKSPFMLHLRLATHGAKNAENTHPHILDSKRIAVAHNGILWSPSHSVSDTVFFCRTVLYKRTPDQIFAHEFQKFLTRTIGTGNKLAFLRDDGSYTITNEDLGDWIDGTWYSNIWSFQKRHFYNIGGHITQIGGHLSWRDWDSETGKSKDPLDDPLEDDYSKYMDGI